MYNPHLQKKSNFADANHYFTRKDEFPHPDRVAKYHISGTLHSPKQEIVYTAKSEAEFWRARHIDALVPADEWFDTPQEAEQGRKDKLATAKKEKEKVDEELKKSAAKKEK